MKNKKNGFFSSPAFTTLLFIVAAGLIIASTIGGVMAALNYSAEYKASVEMKDIGIDLLENGEEVGYRNYKSFSDDKWDELTEKMLFTGLLAKDKEGNEEAFVPGRIYDEVITVKNSGNIPEYVRVEITKYWADENKNKDAGLSPAEIELHVPEGNGWIKDEKASSSPEREVYYYDRILGIGEKADLTDTLKVDSDVLRAVTITEEKSEDGKYTKYTTKYDYDGIGFYVEVTADAVQTHNPEHAIKSAWGRDVTIKDGTLTLD